jgi:hypothetical protein
LHKIQALNEFLIAQSQRGGTVVLLVDEAQNLTDDVLENLRLLSNLETASEKLLQIVLVGQTELEAKLAQPQLRQIKQRVALHCRLDCLKDREIGPFINYRLRIAGYEGEDLFAPDAVCAVAFYSKGIPRLINVICDNALLVGYATSAKQISGDIVREVAVDLQLDGADRAFDVGLVSSDGLVISTDQNKKRHNVDTESLVLPLRNTRSLWLGTLAAAVLVASLIGGMTFYGASIFSWVSDVVSTAKNFR